MTNVRSIEQPGRRAVATARYLSGAPPERRDAHRQVHRGRPVTWEKQVRLTGRAPGQQILSRHLCLIKG
ncbi:MAG: hypothetical protein ACE5G1_03630 [bacterium]